MKQLLIILLLGISFSSIANDDMDYDVCANPLSQEEINICAYKSFKQVDNELNRLWHIIMNDDKLSSEGKDKLKKAQIKWILHKEAICNQESEIRGELGSYKISVWSKCLEDLTAQRVSFLEEIAFQ